MTFSPDSLDGLTTLDCANLVASSSKLRTLLSEKQRLTEIKLLIVTQLSEVDKEIQETEREKIHDKSMIEYFD